MSQTSLIMAIPDVVLVVRRDGRVLDSLGGRTFSVDLGPDQWEGCTVEELLPREVAECIRAALPRVLRTRQPINEVAATGDGQFELRISAHGRERALVVVRDLEETNRTPAQVLEAVSTTGETLTRDTFLHLLNDSVNTSRMSERPLALLSVGIRAYVDLSDNLDCDAESLLGEQMNDRIDTVLEQFKPDHGSMVSCRLGVDRFAVLAASIMNGEASMAIGQQLSDALMQPFDLPGGQLQLVPMIGIAISPQDGSNGEHLLKNAITAMEDAAVLDRTGIERYTDTRRLRTERRQDLVEELRWAISEEQFALHYQPVFELNNAVPTAIEAFLRWNHPLRGMLSAGDFLPLAEATGQIQRISEWVVERACQDLAEIRERRDITLSVSVNLSRHYFSRLDLVENLVQIFTRNDFDPAWLQLDITERMLMRPDQVGPVLANLKKLGIGLQVDDFGSGYTSLKQLRRFPLDALKIDGDFIGGIGKSNDDEAVCRSVIALAHAYGMRCIAEAVETSEQVKFLRAAGCDDIQGNLFGNEMALNSLLIFLEQFQHGRSFGRPADDAEVAPG